MCKGTLLIGGFGKYRQNNLQILFVAEVNPVQHFLAIDAQGDKIKTQQALNDWYLAEKKDYEAFALNYPMNGELELQEDKTKAMRAWCYAEKIKYTPTIFINGYELPTEYSVEDLREIFSE